MSELQTKRQRAVVICPGRGTYNKDELGYLQRLHKDRLALLDPIEQHRQHCGQPSILQLDSAEKYNMRTHTAGENASALIYGCALADFHAIDQSQYDIVAVTGNSMGWYIALAVAGALSPKNAIEVINTMGSMMSDGVIGGQMIYPIINEDWQRDKQQMVNLAKLIQQINALPDAELYLSIDLGGYWVMGGNNAGLKELEAALPPLQDKYPMRLFNHAAFHTPVLKETAIKAQSLLAESLFNAPRLPMIDGRGKIWQPYQTDTRALHHYTLDTQVVCPYNYSKAVEVAVKEFAPDKLIILGPGATLGGATAQALIAQNWLNMSCKADFITQQKTNPYILAMGMPEQRQLVTG